MPLVVDLVAGLLIVALAVRGWRRGIMSVGLALAGLVTGYGAAFFLHRPVGDLLGRAFSLQPLIAYPLAGMLMLGTAVGMAAVARRWAGRRAESLPGRIGGASLGAVHGLLLVILLAGALQLRAAVSPDHDIGSSVAVRIALPPWQWATRAVVRDASRSETLAATAARFVAEPARTSRSFEKVLADKRFVQLVQDQGAVSSSPWFVALAQDPQFVEAARSAGFVDGQGEGQGTTAQLAQGLTPLTTAMRALSADQELQQLLADPALKAALDQGNVARLLNDPKFNRAAALVIQRVKGEK